MKKLPAVEEARAIMNEGMEWGVWKWLTEKLLAGLVLVFPYPAIPPAED